MKFIQLLFICIIISGCVNDDQIQSYPYYIPQDVFVITHEDAGDSISLGEVSGKGLTWMGKSNVNEFKGFEEKPLYISYESSGLISLAFAGDSNWTAVPLVKGVTRANGKNVYPTQEGGKIELTSGSTCIRSLDDSTSSLTLVSNTQRMFNASGVESSKTAWIDSLWWSKDQGMFARMHFRGHGQSAMERVLRIEGERFKVMKI